MNPARHVDRSGTHGLPERDGSGRLRAQIRWSDPHPWFSSGPRHQVILLEW